MREIRLSGLMRGGKQTVIGLGLSIRRFPPTLPAARFARVSESERLANAEMGVPKGAASRRPLAGAALAAVEAKECRRINRLLEEQWERSTERAMAAAEEAQRYAIPGMWATL
jgi:hypothetical protein